MKGMLLKVVSLRLDPGNGRNYQKPWLAKGSVWPSGEQTSLAATPFQNSGAGTSGEMWLLSTPSFATHQPRYWEPHAGLFHSCHLFKGGQGDPVCDEAHPVPVPTSKLMLVTCGDLGQLGAP